MKTLGEQIEIMKACADGRTVKFRHVCWKESTSTEDWESQTKDMPFDWVNYDYRIETLPPPSVGLGNEFFVGVRGENIVTLKPIPQVLSKEQALNLAAWLYMLADEGDGKFEKIVKEERGE
jgi:hypothetical protein